jgi:tRNA threonylcarbamoyladenosine biosynthesis protein TsaB
MTSLLLDTATEKGVLSLGREGISIAHQEISLGLTASNSIIAAIDALCEKAHVAREELTYIAVGIGPGSYTGIRIGVACAKALSCAFGIPLVGISGLYGFVPDEGFSGSFLSAIDARIGGMYVIQENEPKLISLEQFIMSLHGIDCIVTPSQAAILRRLQSIGQYPSIIERAPSALVLHALAEEKFKKGELSLDGDLPILYLRPTQAEIEKL